jgi:phosphoribosylformimino-5-aminoimidazole carboxamide ribonucleotide (ProFAR) isomerase
VKAAAPKHGLAGGIVGRALYTGAVDLAAALAAVEAACS